MIVVPKAGALHEHGVPSPGGGYLFHLIDQSSRSMTAGGEQTEGEDDRERKVAFHAPKIRIVSREEETSYSSSRAEVLMRINEIFSAFQVTCVVDLR